MNTKQLIIDCIYELVKNKRIENITVQDILNYCHVARSTFYRYFNDKHDLINWYYQSYVDKLINNYDGNNWLAIMRKILEFLEQHASYFKKTLSTSGQNAFGDFIKDYGYSFYRTAYLRNSGKIELNEEESLVIGSYCEGASFILREWLKKDNRLDIDTIANLLYKLSPKELKEFV